MLLSVRGRVVSTNIADDVIDRRAHAPIAFLVHQLRSIFKHTMVIALAAVPTCLPLMT